jgi:hypothetical protein
MAFMKILVKMFLCIIILGFFSCYSSPENINNSIDYSDTISSKTMIYDIGIDIFNKNLPMLKQNIFNEIIQNNGKITQEEIENINSHRIVINIPRNNTVNFIIKIKTFGIVVNENKRGNDTKEYFNNMEIQLENIKYMLEKYNHLLQDSTTISDKLMLEKEINNAEREIEMLEKNKKEIESRIEYNTITIIMYNK